MAGLPQAMQMKKVKLAEQHSLAPEVPPVSATPAAPKPVRVVNDTTPPKPVSEATAELTPTELTEFEVVDEGAAPASAPAPAVATPTSAPAQAISADVDWKEAARVHEERWKSLQGINEREVNENRELRSQNIALEQRIAALETNFRTPPAVQEDPLADLSPEEKEEYKGSIGVITKLADHRAKQIINATIAPLKQEIEELRKNNQSVVTQFETTDANTFAQRVASEVKDVKKLVSLPQWQEFHSKRVSPFVEMTIGEALKKAHAERNLENISAIFNDFRKFVQPNSTTTDAYSGLSTTPNSGATTAQLNVQQKKPILKGSGRKQAQAQFLKRQITNEKFRQIEALYKEADAEGRIDWNK